MLGGILMMLGVILGAFGYHYLSDKLSEENLAIFNKAVYYQIIHALAILIVGVIEISHPKIRLEDTGILFFIGILLFCGSLHILIFYKDSMFEPLKYFFVFCTPAGGLFFIAGWIAFVFQTAKLYKK